MGAAPLFPTLRGYRRSWIVPDAVAGLTLAAIAVPEQMATAKLANLPAITGLYAFLAGTVLFVLLGTNRHLSVGADSTIAPVFAAGAAAVTVGAGAAYERLILFSAVLVGIAVSAVGVFRFGWIAEFLSSPVVAGVLAGIGVEIAVRQLPSVLGVAAKGTTTIGRLQQVFDQRASVNGWAFGIAVAVLVVVVTAERINRRIPGALIGLVGAIAVVAAFGLAAHGVKTIGAVHGGLPSPRLPHAPLAELRRMVGPLLVVSFLCVIQTAATVRAGGSDRDSGESFTRDLIAIGAGNVAAGFAGAFPVNASPPRTEVTASSGGRTQAAGLVAAAIVAVVVSALTGLLRDLPQAALGALLLFVASRLLKIDQFRRVWDYDRTEFLLALAAAVTVSLVGTEQGIATAIILALAQRTRLSVRPRDAILGREIGTDHWIPPDVGKATEDVPGVLVYLLYAPLWYGNADNVTARIRNAVVSATTPVRAFVLDTDGMSDIDFTGAQALEGLFRELAGNGVKIGVARSSHLVHHYLKHGGLLKAIGTDHTYVTVDDAVKALAV